MAQSTSAHAMTVKVDIDGDVRRFAMKYLDDESPVQILEAIRTAVAEGFGMEEPALPALKYRDDEGDLCTLVPASVGDMLEIFTGKTLRLFASMPPMDSVDTRVEQGAALSMSKCQMDDEVVVDSPAAVPLQEFVTLSSSMHDSGADIGGIDVDDTETLTAMDQQDEHQDRTAENMSGTAELVAMGFSKERAQQALQEAQGNVEQAIEYLLNGECGEQTEQAVHGHEQVQQALQDTQGNVEKASEHLLNGACKVFEKLEEKVQGVLSEEHVQQALQGTQGKAEKAADHLLNGACGAAEHLKKLEQKVQEVLNEEHVQQALQDTQGKAEKAADHLLNRACGAAEHLMKLEQKVKEVLSEEHVQQAFQDTQGKAEKIAELLSRPLPPAEHFIDGARETFGTLEQKVKAVLGDKQVQDALQDAFGKAQQAADVLLDGTHKAFAKLDPKVQEVLKDIEGNVQKLQTQLQEAVAHAREHLQNFEFGGLQTTLEEMMAGLSELQELAQIASKKVRHAQLDSQEEEKFQKIESGIVDARYFVVETLTVLHSQAFKALKDTKEKLSTSLDVRGPESVSSDEAAVEVEAATPTEVENAEVLNRWEQIVDAALSAAEAETTVTEEAPIPGGVSSPSSTADSPQSAPTPPNSPSSAQPAQNPEQVTLNATSLDRAQVFLSLSLSALRSRAF